MTDHFLLNILDDCTTDPHVSNEWHNFGKDKAQSEKKRKKESLHNDDRCFETMCMSWHK